MSDLNSDAPHVRIIPPLIYLAGLAIGFAASLWMPTKIIPNSAAWLLGAALIVCGAVLFASAMLKFMQAGTTMRTFRASSALVLSGPYRVIRNPMYLGLALAYLGIAIAGQSF
jgi:protein-S-isoprenylcysteine O-methyltransferase Ste14